MKQQNNLFTLKHQSTTALPGPQLRQCFVRWPQLMKKSAIAYIVITIFVLCQAIAYLFSQVSLPGYWTDKLVVWLWIIWTPFFMFRHFKHWTAKVYTGALAMLFF